MGAERQSETRKKEMDTDANRKKGDGKGAERQHAHPSGAQCTQYRTALEGTRRVDQGEERIEVISSLRRLKIERFHLVLVEVVPTLVNTGQKVVGFVLRSGFALPGSGSMSG